MTLRRLLVPVAILLWATSALANVIYVDASGGGDYDTLYEGIKAAVDGDTVLVAPGTYDARPDTAGLDFEGKSIALIAELGPDLTVIDCENKGRAFFFRSGEDSSSVIDGFTIRNGWRHSSYGGAIRCWQSSPKLMNLMLVDNESPYAGGGALYCSRSSPIVSGADFVDNSGIEESTRWGGAVMCTDDSSPVFRDVTFSGNAAADRGGAVYCQLGSSPVFRRVSFTWNESARGGAVYCYGESSPTFTDVDIKANGAEWGGGIYCSSGADPVVSGTSVFYGNTASKFGGGMYVGSSAPVLDGTEFWVNTAELGAGLCCGTAGSPVLSGVLFMKNQTLPGGSGGGMYSGGSSITMIRQTVFVQNVADVMGGGLCHEGAGRAVLDTVSFAGNVAGVGGGMWCGPTIAGYVPELNSVTFSANAADVGGGMCLDAGPYGSSDPELTEARFYSNHASAQGGGLYCAGMARPALVGATFSSNHCDGSGGGLYCDTYSAPSLLGGAFSGNTVGGYGGGMYCGHASPTLTDVLFIGNSAQNTVHTGGGGGLCCASGSSVTLVRVTLSGNRADFGGGIYAAGTHEPVTGSFSDVIFDGNHASRGGGLYCYFQTAINLERAVFFENDADYGGGVFCYATPTASLELTNTTLARNDASSGGGLYCTNGAQPALSRSIVAFSTTGSAIECDGGSSPTVNHCCVWGNAGGDSLCGDYYDNMFDDPGFCDLLDGDLTLHSSSPCLPENNAWNELIGAYGEGCSGRSKSDSGSDPGEPPEEVDIVQVVPFFFSVAPNPTPGPTRVSYHAPVGATELFIAIYNARGQLVRTIVGGGTPAGCFAVEWDGKDHLGSPVGSGIYFCRATLGAEEAHRKIVVVR